MIAPGFIEELLARSDITEVIGRHVTLKKSGSGLVGLCPFHAEKSPSFSVTPSRNLYHCFGCGAGGDAVRFLTDFLGLSFVEAVDDLAGRVGLTVPRENISPEDRQRRATLRQKRDGITEVLDKAAAYYRQQLRESERAIAYLKGRGLTGQVAAQFGLGFAPPGWRNLAGVYPQYDEPVLQEAGLVRASQEPEANQGPASGNDSPNAEGTPSIPSAAGADGSSSGGLRGGYDWFRNRVIFPIRAVSGEVIGFGGRVLDDSKPKYLNSPETPVFSKGRELYGLFEARQALREKGYALVVEGYMDVVALAQNGYGNAVATLGTACTADHLAKLFRFTDAVVFSFDGDAAGRRAAGRALEAALPMATDLRSVRFLFLPPEHDPDSYIRQFGPKAFEEQVAQAVPLSRQLIEHAAGGVATNSAEGRARMLAQAKPLWQALPEGLLKQQVLAELAHAGHLAVPDLLRAWGGANASVSEPAADSPSGQPRGRRWGQSSGGREGSGAGSAGAASLGAGQASTKRWTQGLARATPLAMRRPPAALADQAVRLLLLHSDWWDKLGANDQQLLHELGGQHSQAIAWLDRFLADQGAATWATLTQAFESQEWAHQALAWVQAIEPEAQQQQPTELQAVMHRLWITRLEALASQLAGEISASAGSNERQEASNSASTSDRQAATATALQRLREVRDEIQLHRQALLASKTGSQVPQ